MTALPGAFAKLQLLVPGETASPGSATGKTGTPTAQNAGNAFNVSVNAVDANWNLVNTVSDTVISRPAMRMLSSLRMLLFPAAHKSSV